MKIITFIFYTILYIRYYKKYFGIKLLYFNKLQFILNYF